MSGESHSRRATAEVRWGSDPGAIVRVGSRTLHQYWPVLSGYFREVLLPPQRRAEESRVTWSWREPAGAPPPSASELAALRKRLAGEQQLFAENAARGAGRDDDDGGLRSTANLGPLGVVMTRVVAELTGCDDAALASYVCRTEAGLRVHSWGAAAPARVVYPDERSAVEVSGRVLVDGEPAVWRDVFLAEEDGGSVARMRTDDTGTFRFPAVAEGRYRLHAQAGRTRFPAEGLPVTVGSEPISDLVLRHPEAGGAMSAGRFAAQRGRWIAAAVAVLAVILLGVWWARREVAPAPALLSEPGAGAGKTVKAKPDDAADENESSRDQPRPARKTAAVAEAGAARAASGGGGGFGGSSSAGHTVDARWSGRGQPVADSLLERPLVAGGASGLPGGVPGSPAGAAGSAQGGSSGDISAINSGGGADGGGAEKPSPSQLGGKSGAVPQARSLPGAQSVAPATPAAHPTQAAPAPPPGAQDAKQDPAGKNVAPRLAVTALQVALLAHEKVEPAGKTSPDPEAIAVAAAIEDKSTEAAAAALLSDRRAEDLAEPIREAKAGIADGGEPAAAAEPFLSLSVVAPLADDPLLAAVPRAARPAPASPGRIVRMRLEPWQPRMLADRIVPTEPVPVGRTGSVGALRDRLRLAQDEAQPPAFRAPRFQGGVVLELPSSWTGRLYWRDAHGATPPEGSIQEGRAEVRWSGASPPHGANYLLCREDGSTVANLRAEAEAEGWILQTADGIRAFPWLALHHGGESARFGWRAGAGAPLGPAWSENPVRAVSTRVEVSLEGLTAGSLPQSLAVLDRDTGWALVGGVEFTLESRLPTEIARGR